MKNNQQKLKATLYIMIRVSSSCHTSGQSRWGWWAEAQAEVRGEATKFQNNA